MPAIEITSKSALNAFIKSVDKGQTDYTEVKITNGLKLSDAKKLATILPRLTTLRLLDLSNNLMPAEIVQALSSAISQLSTLEKLDLHLNKLGDAGAAIVAMAIVSCPALKFLWLHHNNISDPGAMYVATAIAKSKSLEHVNLYNNNQIRLVGLNGLALAITQSRTLQTLNLRGGDIPPAAAKNLAIAYAFSRSLHTLYVDTIPNITAFNDLINKLNAARFAPQILAFMGTSIRSTGDANRKKEPLTPLQKLLAADGDNAIAIRTYRMLLGEAPTVPLTADELTVTLRELHLTRFWPPVVKSKPTVVLS